MKSRKPRESIASRAGTPINHQSAVPVFYTSKLKGKEVKFGLIDLSMRLFQGGGERSNFTRWSDRPIPSISFPLEVWQKIEHAVDRIEMVDHDLNEVFSIRSSDFRRYGVQYDDAKIGARIKVSEIYWTHLDADGEVIRAAGEPRLEWERERDKMAQQAIKEQRSERKVTPTAHLLFDSGVIHEPVGEPRSRERRPVNPVLRGYFCDESLLALAYAMPPSSQPSIDLVNTVLAEFGETNGDMVRRTLKRLRDSGKLKLIWNTSSLGSWIIE